MTEVINLVDMSFDTLPDIQCASSGTRLPLATAAPQPGSVIEVGDRFTVSFDPALLELDYFQIVGLDQGCFSRLFPDSSVLLGIPGQTRAPVEARVDQANLCLSRKGLGRQLNAVARGGQIVLAVASTIPLSFEVVPPAVISFSESDLDLIASQGTVILQPGWQSVLADLEKRNFSPDQAFQLHEEACSLDLCQPLDKLISLSVLPEFVPYPHQIQAVKTIISKLRGRGLLCDEVGLGKTIEACLVVLEYMLRGLATRVLILTPPSLAGQWQEELRHKFGLDFIVNDEPRFQGWKAHPLVIASLSTAKLAPHCHELSETEFDLVIVDEAHHLRNRNTKAWQLVDRLKKRFILFLTATPIQNSLSDLYSLVTVLKPGHLKTYQEFRRQFVSKTSTRCGTWIACAVFCKV